MVVISSQSQNSPWRKSPSIKSNRVEFYPLGSSWETPLKKMKERERENGRSYHCSNVMTRMLCTRLLYLRLGGP
jgi:hypothetical protein